MPYRGYLTHNNAEEKGSLTPCPSILQLVGDMHYTKVPKPEGPFFRYIPVYYCVTKRGPCKKGGRLTLYYGIFGYKVHLMSGHNHQKANQTN